MSIGYCLEVWRRLPAVSLKCRSLKASLTQSSFVLNAVKQLKETLHGAYLQQFSFWRSQIKTRRYFLIHVNQFKSYVCVLEIHICSIGGGKTHAKHPTHNHAKFSLGLTYVSRGGLGAEQ